MAEKVFKGAVNKVLSELTGAEEIDTENITIMSNNITSVQAGAC